MDGQDPRRAASGYRAEKDGEVDRTPGGPPRAAGQMASRASWVEHLVDVAVRRGDFDDLPLAGKPIPGLDRPHDPDWWLAGLVRREHLSGEGMVPEALVLRAQDERMVERLDALGRAEQVRAVLVEFNARIVSARRQLTGGPPVLTPLRDVEAEVDAWRARRAEAVESAGPPESARRRGRGWRRRDR